MRSSAILLPAFVVGLKLLFSSVHGMAAVAPKLYQCHNGSCDLYSTFSSNRDESGDTLMSQATCLMICGKGMLWPYPTGSTVIEESLAVISMHKFNLQTSFSDSPVAVIFDQMYASFLSEVDTKTHGGRLRRHKHAGMESFRHSDYGEFCHSVIVQVDVSDATKVQMTLDVDESYSLQTYLSSNDKDGSVVVSISAETVFGARHALETLSQLIVWDSTQDPINDPTTAAVGALVIASAVDIAYDAPRFPYRGVMLDLSRHFVPLANIKGTIRAMGYNKMNVLHLHLSDTASFPVELQRQPNVTYYGAYSAEETYSLQDLTDLAVYANAAGVMLLPELDGPAHTAAGFQWGTAAGLGELVICDDPTGQHGAQWVASSLEPPSGQLNLANPNIYEVIADIYSDLADALGDQVEYVHVGGDEIIVGSDESAPSCFNSSNKAPQIISLIEELGLDRTDPDTFYGMWDNYTYRIVDIVTAAFQQQQQPKPSIDEGAPMSDTTITAATTARTTATTDTTTAAATATATAAGSSAGLKKLHIWGGGGDDATGSTYNLMTRADVTEVLPPELYTIQIWDTMATSITPDLLQKGYGIVLSNTDYVYLDCGNAGFTNPGGYWCQPYHEWQHIYNYIADVEAAWGINIERNGKITSSSTSSTSNSDSRSSGNSSSDGRILGSETLLWAEMMDETNLDQKMWPRTAALAEALWGSSRTDSTRGSIRGSSSGSSSSGSSWYAADPRMQQWRETLVDRGVQAEALQTRWCSQRGAYACTIDVGTPQ